MTTSWASLTNFQRTDLLMFSVSGNAATIEILVDGQSVEVPQGVSVAAALLLEGVVPFRYSKVDQSPRAPYCLMGVCAECLVTINDKPGQFACQIVVQQGMRINRKLPPGSASVVCGNAD